MTVRTEEDGGQALVELALLLPVLVFALIGGADLARAYAAQLAVQNAARAGAESAVLEAATIDAQIVAAARAELAQVPGLDAGAATITVTHSTSQGIRHVSVRVHYVWRTLVAWPWIPNAFEFDRTTAMRTLP